MKKFIFFLVSLSLCAGLFAGCGQKSQTAGTPEEAPTVRVAGLKGPTAMGMVKLMQDSENGTANNNYQFTVGTTDEIVPRLSKGEIDIAAIPANLAPVLYHNTNGQIQVFAINTLGVLYLLENGDSVHAVTDLKDKTLLTIGKGAVPEFSLNYVLQGNGINPANGLRVEYKSEAAEIIPLLAQGAATIALLQQPFVTTALEKVPGLRVALDWTEEWDKVAGDSSSLITGVMVVRKEFAEKYPHALEVFAKEYEASAKFTATNLADAAALVEKYGIVSAEIAEKALPACNITYIDGTEMQRQLTGFLQELLNQNPQSIGGSLPDESFYYIR